PAAALLTCAAVVICDPSPRAPAMSAADSESATHRTTQLRRRGVGRIERSQIPMRRRAPQAIARDPHDLVFAVAVRTTARAWGSRSVRRALAAGDRISGLAPTATGRPAPPGPAPRRRSG